jgi:hypothetical protein
MGDFARIAAKTPGLKMYLVSKLNCSSTRNGSSQAHLQEATQMSIDERLKKHTVPSNCLPQPWPFGLAN